MASVISKVKVDRGGISSPHRQIAGAIREAIANGEASIGDRLPPAIDLAAELKVNVNTVLKALRLLRDEGILEFRRGRGVTVIAMPADPRISQQIDALVEEAEAHGLSRTELLHLVELRLG